MTVQLFRFQQIDEGSRYGRIRIQSSEYKGHLTIAPPPGLSLVRNKKEDNRMSKYKKNTNWKKNLRYIPRNSDNITVGVN